MVRKIVRNDRLVSTASWFSLMISAPVSVSTVGSSIAACTLSASCSWLTVPSPTTTMLSTLEVSPITISCAVGRSNSTNVAPPVESLPANLAMPTMVKSRCCSNVVTVMVSPISMPDFLAEAPSMTASLGPSGPRPSFRLHGEFSLPDQTDPYFGGPSCPTVLPSKTTAAVPCTSANADFTCGTDSTTLSSDRSMRSRVSSPKSPSMTLAERTKASVCS